MDGDRALESRAAAWPMNQIEELIGNEDGR
jgi:hypothetical protein